MSWKCVLYKFVMKMWYHEKRHQKFGQLQIDPIVIKLWWKCNTREKNYADIKIENFYNFLEITYIHLCKKFRGLFFIIFLHCKVSFTWNMHFVLDTPKNCINLDLNCTPCLFIFTFLWLVQKRDDQWRWRPRMSRVISANVSMTWSQLRPEKSQQKNKHLND